MGDRYVFRNNGHSDLITVFQNEFCIARDSETWWEETEMYVFLFLYSPRANVVAVFIGEGKAIYFLQLVSNFHSGPDMEGPTIHGWTPLKSKKVRNFSF